MEKPNKKGDSLSDSKEHKLTNEEQWIHDVNEEFAEDIPPLEEEENNTNFDKKDD